MAMALQLLLTAAAAWSVSAAALMSGREAAAARRDGAHMFHLRGEASEPKAAAAADFQVGTQPGKANVVSGFDVVGTWGSGDDLSASVPPTVPATSLYLRATGGSLQLTRAVVEPASLPHLRTSLDGDLLKQLQAKGQVSLEAEKEHRISVVYDCRSSGEAALSLTLEFEGLSSVQIPFQKTCGGEKNTALTVTVGTASQGEKVVIMGTPKWDELKVVGVRTTSATFTLFVDPLSEMGEQVISTPIATGIGSCAARAAPQNADKFSSGKKSLAAGESVDIAVDYRCFRHGNCVVSTEVSFFPDMAPYQPLRWSWTKICGGEALGIDVEVPEVRRLLATDGASNTSFAAPWIAENDMNEHKVRLVNDEARSLEPEVKVRALTVRCLDTKRCTSRISDSMPRVLRADTPLDLHVKYDCHSSGSSMVQLVLATEGHDPVVVTWAKDCAAFGDSFLGIVLIMIFTCTCFACACVGCIRMFSDSPMDGKGGKPLLEGEFIEDENLSQEEIAALDHYEEFYGLQKGAAGIEQIKDSVLGVSGWANKGLQGASSASGLEMDSA